MLGVLAEYKCVTFKRQLSEFNQEKVVEVVTLQSIL